MTQDLFGRVIVLVVAIVGVFIAGSMVMQFLLLWTGRVEPGQADVWRPMFDLVAVLVGGIGGYVTGQTVAQRRGADE